MSASNPALEQFIRNIPLFSLVDSSDMTEVLRLLRPIQLAAGDVLFREGEPGKAMWVLGQECEVSISAIPPNEKRPVVVAYAKTGDVLGEMALVDDGPRSGSAVVTQEGHAHQIDAQEFHAMRATFTPAAFKILRKICMDLCARLRATNERIVPSGHNDVQTPSLPPGVRPEPSVLDEFPAFRGLPAVVKLALAHKLELHELTEMTPIFAEGEISDGAYFILDGEVSVGRNGKTLANLPAGSMFGQVACLDRAPRSASCLTTGPARLLKMSDRDFDHLFESGHRFAYQVVDLVARQLVHHVREANQMLPLPGKSPGKAKTSKPVEAMLPAAPAPDDLELIESPQLELEDALSLEFEIDVGAAEAAAAPAFDPNADEPL